MPKYQFTNPQTGQSVEFEWNRPTPPTEADIDAQFAKLTTTDSPYSAPRLGQSWDLVSSMLRGDSRGAAMAADQLNAPIPQAPVAAPVERQKGMLEKASDIAITPLVPESVRTKVGSVLGGYENVPIQYQGIVDTLQGAAEGINRINPIMASLKGTSPGDYLKDVRAMLGGSAEGALTQTSPLDIAAAGVAKPLAAPIKVGARALGAVGSGVLAAGGVQQASDNAATIPERLGGVGKAAIGVLGLGSAAMPRKAAVAQVQPNDPKMQALIGKQKAIADPNFVPPQPAHAYDPGGATAKFKRGYLDSLNPLKRFMDQSGVKPPTPDDPLAVARLASGGAGAKNALLTHDIKELADTADAEGLRDVLDSYLNYRGMAHHAEIVAMKGDKNWQALKAGKALPEGYTHKTVAQGLQDLTSQLSPQQFQRVQDLGDQIFTRLESNLADLTNHGIISPERLMNIAKYGPGYVPQNKALMTAIDDAEKAIYGSLDPASQKVVMLAKGSEKTTQSPLDASLDLLKRSQWLMDQNKVTRTLFDLQGSNPGNQFLQDMIVPLFKAHKNGKVTNSATTPEGFKRLHFWENGQKHDFAVPTDVAHAIQMSGIIKPDDMLKGALGTVQNIYRSLATTLNAGFTAANIIRDPQDSRRLLPGAQQSFNPLKPISSVKAAAGFYKDAYKEFAKQAHNALKGENLFNDPAYRQLIKAGGGFSTSQANIRLPEEYANPVLRGLAEFANRAEVTTKIAAWKKLKAMGMGDEEAALLVRQKGGSPDFAQRGLNSATANLLFLFFNARVQGIARNIEAVGKNPKMLLTQGPKKLLGPAMTLYAFDQWNNSFKNEDGTRVIDNISDSVKSSNFVIVTPFQYVGDQGKLEHYVVTLPMGHLNQYMHSLARFGTEAAGLTNDSSVSQAGANVVGNLLPISGHLDGDSLSAFGKSLASGIAASFDPTLRIPLEGALGYDLGLGRTTVPRALQEMNPEFQYNDQTSPTARAIASGINALPTDFKVSPAAIEGGVLKKLPGLLASGVTISDYLIGGRDKPDLLTAPQKLGKSVPLGPVVSRFLRGSGQQAKSDAYAKFFKEFEKADGVNRAAVHADDTGNEEIINAIIKDPSKVKSLEMHKDIVSLSKDLGELRKEKRIIQQQAKNIGQDEAVRQLQALNAEEVQLLYSIQSFLGGEDPRERPNNKFKERRDQIERLAKKLIK